VIDKARLRLQAIVNAIALKQEEGFGKGDLVGHPEDEYCYKVVFLKRGQVLAERPSGNTGLMIGKLFPATELFDPNVAVEEAERLAEEARCTHPHDPDTQEEATPSDNPIN